MWYNDYIIIVRYGIYVLKMWWCILIIFIIIVDVSRTISLSYILLLKGENDPCVLILTVNLRLWTLEPKRLGLGKLGGRF